MPRRNHSASRVPALEQRPSHVPSPTRVTTGETALGGARSRLHALAWTTLLAVGITFAGKVLSFGREIALSHYFGASGATDAFFIANAIPGVLWLSFSATINSVFLPLYVGRLVNDERDAARFANEALQIYVVLALATTLLCVFNAGAIVHFTAPAATPATLRLAQTLTSLMAVGFVFTGYVGIQNAVQQARGRFQLPLLTPVIANVFWIGGVLVAARFGDIRIAVVAAVLGWAIQAPLHRLQTRSFYRVTWRPQVSWPEVRNLVRLSVPVMAATFLDQVNIYVGIYLAGELGAGAISQLNYASRIAIFFGTTFSSLVSYFLFPRLAKDAASAADGRIAKTVALGVVLILATTLPPTVVAVALRKDFVGLIYGHGAFTAKDVFETGAAFAFFGLGIVFIALRDIFNRVFFSHQMMVIPLVIGVVASVTNFVASKTLGGLMGTGGIALGASIAAIVYLAAQLLVIARWKPFVLSAELAKQVVFVLVAAGAAYLALTQLLPWLAGETPLVRLALAAVMFGVVFAVVLAPLAWFGGFRRLLTL
jgi:putative peptidoglycan lipid II flippase